ncbi:MAG: flagellar motor switch protein FliM [Steroidobacteraceae bacterium]
MPAAAPRAAISAEEVSALLEKGAADGPRPYDFTAQRINRTQLPLLEAVSKSFAERSGASLSALLGRGASMQFHSLESAKSADLQAALPVPSSLAVVRLKPLPGFAFISVEPNLLFTLLDGFFGGTGRAATDPQAVIAPAAQRFLAMLVRSFAADWAGAWVPVTPVELELVKQETNPRLVQLGAANEAVLVVKFTVEFASHSGTIDWLLPEALLAPVREALAADGGQKTLRSQEAWGPVLTTALQDAELDTRAILAEAQISLRELVRLSPGDIIPIEAPQQVTLLAGDVPLYRGSFGVSQGRNALKILSGASS